MKNEVTNYCIDDLAKDKPTAWTGVRNYQASNFMRDNKACKDMLISHPGSRLSISPLTKQEFSAISKMAEE